MHSGTSGTKESILPCRLTRTKLIRANSPRISFIHKQLRRQVQLALWPAISGRLVYEATDLLFIHLERTPKQPRQT